MRKTRRQTLTMAHQLPSVSKLSHDSSGRERAGICQQAISRQFREGDTTMNHGQASGDQSQGDSVLFGA